MVEKCRKNLQPSEILMEFGKDDDMGECNNCPNLKYKNGMMTCDLLNQNDDLNKIVKGGYW